MVAVGGLAALSWELLWQIKASLSLGISALGTAITLVATMAGMTVGALVVGRWLETRRLKSPLRLYGGLELIIGTSGLLMPVGFAGLETIDAAVYGRSAWLAPMVHLVGIVLLLGPATLAMGATVPLFGLLARSYGSSIAVLYGLNTGGAAVGVLVTAFFVVPLLGVSASIRFVASLNLVIGAVAMLPSFATPPRGALLVSKANQEVTVVPRLGWPIAALVVFVTGLATFGLELAWFRSMRAAFQSTAQSFAIILASVLIPLAFAAHIAPLLRRWGFTLGPLLVASAVAILVATPLVERMDLLCRVGVGSYAGLMLSWFGLSLVIIGPAILLLGMAVPWILQEQTNPIRWGRIYALNTAGAVVGSMGAAWVLLPAIGFTRTSWLVGLLVGVVATALLAGRRRWIAASAVACAFVVAFTFESGLGRLRVQSRPGKYQVVAYEEGPDATVSVIKGDSDAHDLIIDGFHAASERKASGYMVWLGRLPMLAHPDPKRALVICFGTGQTANAVRREHPQLLDVVELNPSVYRMARHFSSNERVLADPRVRAIVMDGRAWLRRCSQRYDVVTLEPMPPDFASSNALYSQEFYHAIAARLNPGGVVAQWVPYHLLAPAYAASIAATFIEVFPDTILWMDELTRTGILVGRHKVSGESWDWPGFTRQAMGRSLDKSELIRAVKFDPPGVAHYAEGGVVITDDNQLLSYGGARQNFVRYTLRRLGEAARRRASRNEQE